VKAITPRPLAVTPIAGYVKSWLDGLPSGYNSRPEANALLRNVSAADVPE
jgi:hypothetical protein